MNPQYQSITDQTEPQTLPGYDNAQSEALQNTLAARYRILKRLGKGSQGAVYLAESKSTHQQVAIKQLHISSVKDWKQYDLFQREASVLKRLDIPGVAKLHETIEILDAETPMALIVQDYIQGEPLQKFISNGHRFQIGQIGDILLQLLDILQKLHQSDPQVVHRDIKPSNILLNYREDSSTPEVHLIDFGAVSNPQVKGGGSTVVGTYGYMAPEQLMGNASAASDIYSLAIVAVYLLSGVPPENLEIQDYHVLIDSHLQHLPYSITAFLRQMLEPRSEDRMTDYDKIRIFLNALISQKFHEIPCENHATTIKHKYSLKKVYSYRQPGNIVLWQELSDKHPRMPPIVTLFTLFITDLSNKLSQLPISFITVSILIISLLLEYGIIINAINSIQSNSFGLMDFFAGSFLFILFLYPTYLFFFHPDAPTQPSLTSFFKTARKSMATVIRIEYISIYSSLIKTSDDINSNKKYTPTWQITYSFNPPDDRSPDALIRTVNTHVEPDIKEGDLIPILYQIHRDKTGEHVYSTPYPIPVTDEFKLAEN